MADEVKETPRLKVAERFVSVNGEGPNTGKLACFLRFAGCNLQCSYCDTVWANDSGLDAEELTAEELADYVVSTGARRVTLTGGEPLLQPGLETLVKLLIFKNLDVEIETNGSVSLEAMHLLRYILEPLDAGTVSFTMDWKLPSSGMEDQMLEDNLSRLVSVDTLKFVIGDEADLERAFQLIDETGISMRCQVYLSPVAGSMEPAKLAAYMVERQRNDVTLQLQLHKIIWPDQDKGV